MAPPPDGPSKLQIEVFAPDEREGFAVWEMP